MQQWMNLMEVNCDPAREEEFRAWFRTEHMADVLTTPGFVGARQHETKEFRDGRGKYLHLYNVVTDDIEHTMKLRRESREEERKRGRYRPNLTMHVWRDVLWRQIAERVAPGYRTGDLQRWVNLVEVNVTPAREAEFSDWYLNVHMDDVLATPGFVGARHYESKEFRDGRGKYLNVYYVETEDIDRAMAVRRARREDEKKRGRYRDRLTIPVWRDVLWKRIAECAVPDSAHNGALPW